MDQAQTFFLSFVFFVLFSYFQLFKKKEMDRGVDVWGLTNPNFFEILDFSLTWQEL